MDVSFSCVRPVLNNEFRHNIVKVVNVMTKFMINNRTDAWKTDVNLLIWPHFQTPRSSLRNVVKHGLSCLIYYFLAHSFPPPTRKEQQTFHMAYPTLPLRLPYQPPLPLQEKLQRLRITCWFNHFNGAGKVDIHLHTLQWTDFKLLVRGETWTRAHILPRFFAVTTAKIDPHHPYKLFQL